MRYLNTNRSAGKYPWEKWTDKTFQTKQAKLLFNQPEPGWQATSHYLPWMGDYWDLIEPPPCPRLESHKTEPDYASPGSLHRYLLGFSTLAIHCETNVACGHGKSQDACLQKWSVLTSFVCQLDTN